MRTFPTPEDAHAEALNLLREAGINPDITIVDGFNEFGYFGSTVDEPETWNEWPDGFPFAEFREAMAAWRTWGLM